MILLFAVRNTILESHHAYTLRFYSALRWGVPKALGFLKGDHCRTQIWGSNLKDKGVHLILRVLYIITYSYIYIYIYFYICIYIYSYIYIFICTYIYTYIFIFIIYTQYIYIHVNRYMQEHIYIGSKQIHQCISIYIYR
jgi:hypothetical protein